MASARLPDVEGDKPQKKKFKACPIGYFHIDIAEVCTEQGKLHMFVAIDRTSKFAFVELHEKATTAVSAGFLRNLLKAVPKKVHAVLTDNGIQFTTPSSAVPLIKEAMVAGETIWAHAFEYVCAKARYRAPNHQAKASLDLWPGRSHEPHYPAFRMVEALVLSSAISIGPSANSPFWARSVSVRRYPPAELM